jgi:hypothetical protein
MDPASEMGPLANTPQLEKVAGLMERARAEGAEVAHGGCVSPAHGGLFYEPTILTGVRPEMEIAREEVFGRENGRDDVHAYTEVKTIWVALADAVARDPFALG